MNDSWHYEHMLAPGVISEGSVMPEYPWLFEQNIDYSKTKDKINAMRTLGVPYAKVMKSQPLQMPNHKQIP